MFKTALSPKRSFLDAFKRSQDARAAAMLYGEKIIFLNKKGPVYLPIGKKIAGLAEASVAIIPEEQVFYKIVSLAAGADFDSTISGAVAALPLRKDEAIWEYAEIQPLAAEPGHKDFAFWAVSRKYLEDCGKILRSAGIRVADFLPEAVGIVKAVFPLFETSDAVLILAVSASRSTLTAFAGRAIHFAGAVPVGSKALEAGDREAEDSFVSEILQATLWYKNRALHEHGASHSINKIVFLGKVPESVINRVALNTQLRVESPDILQGASAELAPLIGALKR